MLLFGGFFQLFCVTLLGEIVCVFDKKVKSKKDQEKPNLNVRTRKKKTDPGSMRLSPNILKEIHFKPVSPAIKIIIGPVIKQSSHHLVCQQGS